MNRSVTLLASIVLAAPAIAGSAPGFVTSWETYTRAWARAGSSNNPVQVVEDLDPFSSFFGTTTSAARAEHIDPDDGLVDLGQADSMLSIAGSGRSWTLDANLSGRGFGYHTGALALAEFGFSASFDLGQGESLMYGGDVQRLNTDQDDYGIGRVRARIYRDDVLVGSFHYDFHTGPFQQMVEEVSGATYRLEFEGLATGGGQGTGGGSSPMYNTVISAHMDIAIIPAPITAAPLALAGVFAARRRRA